MGTACGLGRGAVVAAVLQLEGAQKRRAWGESTHISSPSNRSAGLAESV